MCYDPLEVNLSRKRIDYTLYMFLSVPDLRHTFMKIRSLIH